MCEIKERVIKKEYARLSGGRGGESKRDREGESQREGERERARDRGREPGMERARRRERERARDSGREPFILKPPSLSEHPSAPRLHAAPCC